MRLAILHLSDLHVNSDQDTVLTRATKIADSIRPRLADATDCAIAISGDVAQAGLEEQYNLAFTFIATISDQIHTYLGGDAPPPIVIVPGNHDCDLSHGGEVRNLIVSRIHDNVDESMIRVATEVQDAFFELLGALAPPDQKVSRLEWHYNHNYMGKRIRFRCLNTAWCSTNPERQGRLWFPTPLAEAGTADLEIALLHHPFNWIEANNGRALRHCLEGSADIILTGHEHVHSRWIKSRPGGERNEFIEGGLLGAGRARDHTSAFNLILLDLSTAQQRFVHFVWDGEKYLPTSHTEPQWDTLQVTALRVHKEFEISDNFRLWLKDLGLSVTHKAKDKLSLDDIFVYPDLSRITDTHPTVGELVRANQLLPADNEAHHYLITGRDRVGKTSLTKRWFSDLYNSGYVPVLLDGRDIRYVNDLQFDNVVRKAFHRQYSAGEYEQYRQLSVSRRVLIVDDFHKSKIRRDRMAAFLTAIERSFHHAIFLSHDLAQRVSELSDVGRVLNERPNFDQYQIEYFGHVRRDDLVQKWIAIDPSVADRPEVLARKVIDAERTIDLIIGRNFVPSLPVFLLSILQGIDSMGSVDLHASTHGYFYELLIRNDLAAGATQVDYGIKVQFLSYLAYSSYRIGSEEISDEEFRTVHAEYERSYAIRRPVEQLQSELQNNNVVVRSGDGWRFKYDYIRLYFIALYISKHITEAEVKEDLLGLLGTIHDPLSANILLFLAHLCEESVVIDGLIEQARGLFSDQIPATLDEDVYFVDASEDVSDDIQYIERAPGEARRRFLSEMDAEDKHGSDIEDSRSFREEHNELSVWMRDVGSAFRVMQILGQILKNFPGTLKADPKKRIADECYSIGLRTLASVIALLRDNREGILGYLQERYREEAPYATNAELREHAFRSITGLTRLLAYGSVQRIAAAVGSRDLMETFRALRSRYDSPAGKLIEMSIHLDQMEALPKVRAKRLGDDIDDLYVARSVLRMLVIRHLHLFDVPYVEKEAICAKLSIPYKRMVMPDPRRKLLSPSQKDDRK